MIRLILGRAGSGKTTRVMQEIAARVQNSEKSLTLVVPEQYSHSAERRLLGIAGDTLSLHGEVLSFKRLASRVFEELGAGLPTLDKGGALLILHRALRAVSEKLEIYGDTQKRSLFLGALQRTISELRNSGITPENLLEAAGNDETALSKKLRDLGLIMAAYNAFLEAAGKYDTSSALTRLSEAIAGSSYSRGRIYFDGFNDFTEPETLVIKALIQSGAELCFCLTTEQLDSENDAFQLPCDTANAIIMLAHEHNMPVETTYIDGSSARPPELLHMESELFGYQTSFDGNNTAIEIYSASDQTNECEYAAAIVKRLLRKGLRYSDIAVMSHGNAAYLRLCESVFSRHGLPTFRTGRDDILDKPPIRLIVSTLDILSSRWEYEDVFAYLKTGLSGIPTDRLDELENFVYRRGMRGSVWLRDEPWFGAPEEIDVLRREVAAPFKSLSAALKLAATGGEMLHALYAFLEDMRLAETLVARAKELRAVGQIRLADEYLQLWDIIVGALDQMYLATENTLMDTKEFALLLKLLLSCYDVGVIPVALDRVTIGDTAMSRRLGVRALIVLGATDANMPQIRDANGIFSAAELDALVKTLLLPTLSSPEKLLLREFNVIYSALSSASDYLAVVYNTLPGTRPAFVAGRLERMFDLTPQSFPASELTPPDELDAIKNANIPTDRGVLSQETTASLYGEKLRLSATRVEKFASCKYAFFMQNGLSAKPREPESFDAPEAGTFIHYILERTASEIKNLGGFESVSENDVRLLTRRFTSDYIAEKYPDFDSRSERFRYLLRRLATDAERITLDLATELGRSSFEPLEFEAPFNAALPDGSLSVTGIIDRVDVWRHEGEQYLRVMDYKTGTRKFTLSDVYYGLGMQMLIYLYALGLDGGATMAGALYTPARDELYSAKKNESDEKIAAELSKALRRKGLLLDNSAVIDAMEEPDEKLYLPVDTKGGGYSGDSLISAEQFGKLNAHVAKTLGEISAEIAGGSVDANPYIKNDMEHSCRYCKFAAACGFGSLPGDEYRRLRTIKTADFWDKLDNKLEGKG